MNFSTLDSSALSTLLTIMSLQILAVISPGPDFAVVTRNSIVHSRKIGIATTFGIAAGVLFHVSYLVLGFSVIAAVISKILVFIKAAGCLYLGYIGWKGIRSYSPSGAQGKSESARSRSVTARSAFFNGFLTNILNPKAILFLLSLFTVAIHKDTPHSVLVLAGVLIVAITFLWFFLVAISFSGALRNHLLKYSHWIDRVTGGFLLFISTKIGLSILD